MRDPEGFLELAVSVAQWWERDAEPTGFVRVLGGADAQPGAAAGEHVEAGDGLDQDSGMAVAHPRHQSAELTVLVIPAR